MKKMQTKIREGNATPLIISIIGVFLGLGVATAGVAMDNHNKDMKEESKRLEMQLNAMTEQQNLEFEKWKLENGIR